MQTTGLNHVILTVSNTERSRAFYGDLLRFPITILEKDPDKSFLFTCGGVQFFSFHRASLIRTTDSVNFG